MKGQLYFRPLKLKSNRVWRPFVGGKFLDEWQGSVSGEDKNIPEEWVASTVKSSNKNTFENEGLSLIKNVNDELTLKEVIYSDPNYFLGKSHVEKYGSNMAVLIKVIDSCSRLMIQVHPNREYARRYLNSDFGKTEAWYIFGTRKVDGQDPYILLGFKPGITKENWSTLFLKQDIKEIENALHRFYVKPGDVYLVKAGIPHAVGSGCFFLEVQEPSDYTMRVERKSPTGRVLSDSELHQGVGFEKMLDCFNYKGLTRAEVKNRWYKKPLLEEKGINKEVSLISYKDTSYFAMSKLEIKDRYNTENKDVFSVVVVLNGEGKLKWSNGEINIEQADELFLPAGLEELTWKKEGKEDLSLITCYPPK